MIDLSSVIQSLSTQEVIVYNCAEQSVVDGVVYENLATAGSVVRAAVQPLGGQDLKTAPEGVDSSELWTVWLSGAEVAIRDQVQVPSIGRLEVYQINDRDRGQGKYKKLLCRLITEFRNSVEFGSVP